MTVGILGMAFKAESDDIRSSLSYKLKRLLRFKAGRVLCTDPYVASDDDLWPLDEVLAESDLLVIAAPHKAYADLDADVPGRRHVEPARATACACDAARLGRHPRLQRGRRRSSRASTGSSTRSRCRARCSSSYDTPDDTTRAVPREVRRATTRGSCPTLNTYGRGPACAHPLRHRARRRPTVVVVTMADGCDDPQQIDAAGPPRRAGRRRRRRVPVHARAASRSAARSLKSTFSRLAGLTLLLVRAGRHARRDQLVQGVRPRVRAARSASSPTPASRSASSWSPRRAATGCRSPRSRRSGSTARDGAVELQGADVAPALPALVLLRLRPADQPVERAGSNIMSKIVGQRSAGLHRRLRRAGAARARPRGRRHRQLLEVRAGRAVLRRPPGLPARRGRRAATST